MSMDQLRILCIALKEVQEQKATLEDQLAEVNTRLDTLRTKEIPELMESLGLRNATFDGVGRIQLAADIYASTKEGQREAAMQWLRDCGYEDMIVETYNASSLKALFRRQIAQGVEIPTEIFNVHPFIRASVVKA